MHIVTPSVVHLELFVGAALALLLIPGPAVLFIVGRSIEQGRRAGLVSVLGIHLATLVHLAAAVVGLSALLAASALAFGIVKYVGAAYLIWLGLKKLFGTDSERGAPRVSRSAPRHSRLLADGFVVNLLNPKTALFFLAFLPQFVDVQRAQVAAQIAFLGLLFIALGLVTDSAYALGAAGAGALLRRHRRFARIERNLSGVLLIGLGVSAAFAGTRRK